MFSYNTSKVNARQKSNKHRKTLSSIFLPKYIRAKHNQSNQTWQFDSFLKRIGGKMQLNGTGKHNGSAELLAEGKACKAILWPTPKNFSKLSDSRQSLPSFSVAAILPLRNIFRHTFWIAGRTQLAASKWFIWFCTVRGLKKRIPWKFAFRLLLSN